MKKFIVFCLVAALGLLSCAPKSNRDYLPAISGPSGDVLVIIGKNIWGSKTGSKLKEVLTSEFPSLPQKEARFTVLNTPHSTFNGTYRFHRNIIICEVRNHEDGMKKGIFFEKDKWAKHQAVITIVASSIQETYDIIAENEKKIINFLEEAEIERATRTSMIYANEKLKTELEEKFSYTVSIPKDFSVKMSTDDFMWISYETTYENKGVLIYTYPIEDINNVDLKYLIKKRDEVLKKNVPGAREDSYMITSDYSEVLMTQVTSKSGDYLELRGLWELKNDFMGGPFITNVYIDEERKMATVIDGFIYAPRYNKREYVRQMTGILRTFKEVKKDEITAQVE